MPRFILLLLISAFLAACAAQGNQLDSSGANALGPGDVLNHSPLGEGVPGQAGETGDMLALSPEMIQFLETRVGRARSQNEQLRQLAWAVMRSGEFTLVYDDSTSTAAETFASRRGNCMAFTNMFIAMARYFDLNAKFQEVVVPSTWSMSGSGDAFLYSQHINVYIDLKQGRWREVDFNIYDFDHDMESRVISDQRARAHFHNNIGAEAMLAGDTDLALARFRQALSQDWSFAPAWINLGVLHRRAQHPDEAEVAFLEALRQSGTSRGRMSDRTLDVGWMPSRVSDNGLLAMSNLASLYEEQGKNDLAERYFTAVHAHRMKNPYYRYQMAAIAFEEGDYDAAIEDLRFAIRRQKSESKFYYLLSLSYMQNGNNEAAWKWMNKARDIAESTGDSETYSYKLDLLRSLDSH